MHYLYGSKAGVPRKLVATFDSEQQLLACVARATLSNHEGVYKFEQGSSLAGYEAWGILKARLRTTTLLRSTTTHRQVCCDAGGASCDDGMPDNPNTAEQQKPRRRWSKFGGPWGLLAKTNPRASWSSVVRHAIAGAVFGPTAYGALIYFRGLLTEYLGAKLVVSSLLFAFVAGVVEWQVDEEEV